MINFSIKIQIGTTLYNYYIENEKDIKFEEKDHENIIERRRFFVGKLKISRTLNPEIWDRINLEEFWNENYVNFYISENSNVRLHYRGKFKYSEFNIDYDNCTFDIVNMINADKYSNMLSNAESTYLRLDNNDVATNTLNSQRRSYFFATATDVNTTKNGYTKIAENSNFRIWITEIIKVLPDGHISNSLTAYQTKVSNGDDTILDWIRDTDALQWFRPMKLAFYGLGYANTQLTPFHVYMGREQVSSYGTGSDIWVNTLIQNVQDNSRYLCTIRGYGIGQLVKELMAQVRINVTTTDFQGNYVFDSLFVSSVELSNRSGIEQVKNEIIFEANLKKVLKILHQFGYYYMFKKRTDTTNYDYDMVAKSYSQWYPQTSTGLDLTNTGFNQPNKFSFDEKITSEMTFKFKKGSGSFEQAIALFFESELEKETVTFDFITDILGVHLDDEKNLDLVIYAANLGYSQYEGNNLSIETNYTLNTVKVVARYYRYVRDFMTRFYELNGITTNTGGYEKKIKKAATIKVPMCIGDIIDKKVATTKLGTGEITKVTQTINDNMYAIEINY